MQRKRQKNRKSKKRPADAHKTSVNTLKPKRYSNKWFS